MRFLLSAKLASLGLTTNNAVRVLACATLVVGLAGCGGSADPAPAAPAPVVPVAAPTVGAKGGTVAEPSGATVIVPAGAIATETTIRVAMDSTGAPALPAGLVAAGNTYVITPHGGEFAQPVEVRIPVPNVTLLPTQELKLAKAQPGGEWEVLASSQLQDGKLVAQVNSFSFFVPVTVTYILPLSQLAPMAVTSSSLHCYDIYDKDCQVLVGAALATFSVATNNGQLPAVCPNAILRINTTGSTPRAATLGSEGATALPNTGGSITRGVSQLFGVSTFVMGVYCPANSSYSYVLSTASVHGVDSLAYPRLAVLIMPPQLDVVEGLRANLDAVLEGGSSTLVAVGARTWSAPTRTNRAEIDWQRSDDGGSSWQVVARSYQDEADPRPLGSNFPWRVWSVRHGFVASAADQGALMRIVACYTPPDVAAPPCVTSTPTRINVLQQSALPTITEAPRSLLVKTGQTASLAATASGAPAPTLQWQTRAANAAGAWADVSSGSGATTGNHTTAALTLADNGVQYRIVATNALGSAPSAPVTVSVSDLDVAPTLSTQPASLGVSAGNDAVFAIAARGTEALSYQWRKDGTQITGANSAVLRLAAVSAGQSGAYSVTVSNAAGSVDSNPATLTVSAGVPAIVAPTIVTQPVSVLVNAGNTATFAVGASGGPLTYQWQRDSVDIAGATAAFYSIAAAAVGDAATYAVVVSNSAGSDTSFNVRLTVNAAVQLAPPAITTQPATLVVAPGAAATLAVAASGSAPLSYQWRRNGVDVAGATGAVLTLTAVSSLNAGSYTVAVSNALGGEQSAVANIIVLGAPAITQQPAAATATEGATATFTVGASGDALRYQWTRNQSAIVGANAASYTTPVLTLADSGAVYGVIVYNGADLVLSQGAVLTVNAAAIAPTVTQQPVNVTVSAGLPANICAVFGGTPPLALQLARWDGTQWDTVASVTHNDNSGICVSTPNLQLADSGAQFRFFANNASAFGVMTDVITVTVTPAPTGRLALVANSNANTLSVYRADATSGVLSLLGTTGTGANPYAIAITPSGLFAFVTNLVGNNVSSYSVNTTTGAVTLVGSSVSSVNPYGIAMDPLGRFTWVANYSAHTVSAYSINGATGQLTAVGAPVASGSLPYAVAAHPSGNYVYVANEFSNSVSAFSVNTSTGALTLLAGTVANSVLRPHSIVVDPSGRFVYVTDQGSSVAAFRVNASTGVLSVVAYTNTGTVPTAVAVHPGGLFVYATTSNGVSAFAVNSTTGALTAIGSAVAAGSNPTALALDAAGTHLYVTNAGSSTTSGFSVNATTGTLTSLGAGIATGSGPGGIVITP